MQMIKLSKNLQTLFMMMQIEIQIIKWEIVILEMDINLEGEEFFN